MPKKQKKSIDDKIDNLAQSVAWGFEAVEKRFDEVDEKFEKIDRRFDEVDKRFDKVDSRLNTLEALLASNRIERLEDSMRQVKTLLKIN
ncbi:MAG: hypothetical protein AAB534_02725 [Patescibacteria group bacterium]